MKIPTFFLPFAKRKDNGGDRMVTIQEVREILGKDRKGNPRVCDAEEIFRARNEKCTITPIPLFLLSTIKLCAQQNKRKQADWRLIYIIGFRLRRLLLEPFTSRFFYKPDFIFEERFNDLLDEQCHSGYWLINFEPRYRDKSLDLQKRELGTHFTECWFTPEHVFVEALISYFLVTGVYLCNDIFHQGLHIRIGYFDPRGILMVDPNIKWHSRCRPDTGVVSYFKPLVLLPESPVT